MADTTTELEVLDQIVDVLGGQSGQHKTVVPVLEDIRDLLSGGGGGGGYNPALSVGRADALTGADETAQWAQRVSTGSGAATVRSVQGAAVAWNQLFNVVPITTTSNGVTFTVEDGSIVANGTTTGLAFRNTAGQLTADHKYLYKGCPSGGSLSTYYAYVNGPDPSFTQRDTGNGVFFTAPSSGATNMIVAVASGNTASNIKFTMQLFDLTQMFGSGNEPTTVAEFQALYPEAYYPYSAPTLKPVRIAGIASTDAQGNALDSVEWEAYTLWGAGTAGDTLYADRIETRMGVVDLGTIRWVVGNTNVSGSYEMLSDTLRPYVKIPPSSNVVTNIRCLNYDTRSGADVYLNNKGIAILANGNIAVFDPDYNQQDSAADFKAAMSGVLLYYELATPTTTPISPALPMTYRVQTGGSESIIVPAGEISAPPVLTIADGESAGELVMDSLACIATPDGPTATSSHAVGTYLTMQGKLYKVTSAIAVGETIKSGTNVTQTTVMAELIARTA